MKLDEPMTIEAVDLSKVGVARLLHPMFGASKVGKFVSVRKAGEGEKTKLGLYLGDLPYQLGGRIADTEEGKTLVIEPFPMGNPCIYVFDDKQFVYGFESWWGEIRDPDHLREITDGDIENVWYVQALKQLSEKEAASE
jgi:hypothetical protein